MMAMISARWLVGLGSWQKPTGSCWVHQMIPPYLLLSTTAAAPLELGLPLFRHAPSTCQIIV